MTVDLAGYEVGLGTREDAASILELINVVQPGIPWTEKHLHWQFFDTPSGPSTLYLIRNSVGKLVSLYCAVSQLIRVAGRVVPARMIQDVMTHPECRGKGFLHHLAGLCLQQLQSSGTIGYTFPNERSEKSFRRTGWIELCAVPRRNKPLGTATLPGGRYFPGELEMRALKAPFGEEATRIWEESGLGVGVNRDAAYLNWRYSKPNVDYFRFEVGGGKGLLILKLYSEGQRRTLHICDLLVKARHRNLVPEVLDFCAHFAGMNAAETLTAWLPRGHAYSAAFDDKGLGMQEVTTRYVFVCPVRVYAAELAESQLWHLSQGDSDVY